MPPHIHQGDEAIDDSLEIMGVRIIVYIDNMLIVVETSEQASQHLETLLWTLQSLGFIINQEKSVTIPTQVIELLGLMIDSLSMELSLPGEKLRQIKMEAARLFSQQLVSARALSQFIEKLSVAAQAVAPAPSLPPLVEQLEKYLRLG